MKPYAGTQKQGSMKMIFNYQRSRTRIVTDNTFGIITSVFRILRKPILLEPKTAKKALVYLHNFLRKNEFKTVYNLNGAFYVDYSVTYRTDSGGGLNNIIRLPRRSATYAQAVKSLTELPEYFILPQGMYLFNMLYDWTSKLVFNVNV